MWRWDKLKGLVCIFKVITWNSRVVRKREREKKLSAMPNPMHGGNPHADVGATHAYEFLFL